MIIISVYFDAQIPDLKACDYDVVPTFSNVAYAITKFAREYRTIYQNSLVDSILSAGDIVWFENGNDMVCKYVSFDSGSELDVYLHANHISVTNGITTTSVHKFKYHYFVDIVEYFTKKLGCVFIGRTGLIMKFVSEYLPEDILKNMKHVRVDFCSYVDRKNALLGLLLDELKKLIDNVQLTPGDYKKIFEVLRSSDMSLTCEEVF